MPIKRKKRKGAKSRVFTVNVRGTTDDKKLEKRYNAKIINIQRKPYTRHTFTVLMKRNRKNK